MLTVRMPDLKNTKQSRTQTRYLWTYDVRMKNDVKRRDYVYDVTKDLILRCSVNKVKLGEISVYWKTKKNN